MNRYAKSSLIFLAGLFLGALIASGVLYKTFSYLNQFSVEQQTLNWGQKAYQAYANESSEIAIWALENYADMLSLQIANPNTEIKLLQHDLFLCYSRLATVSKSTNNKEKFDQNINRAISVAKQVRQDKLSAEDILSMIKKLDNESLGKSKN